MTAPAGRTRRLRRIRIAWASLILPSLIASALAAAGTGWAKPASASIALTCTAIAALEVPVRARHRYIDRHPQRKGAPPR